MPEAKSITSVDGVTIQSTGSIPRELNAADGMPETGNSWAEIVFIVLTHHTNEPSLVFRIAFGLEIAIKGSEKSFLPKFHRGRYCVIECLQIAAIEVLIALIIIYVKKPMVSWL